MHFRKLTRQEVNIDTNGCNCKTGTDPDIESVVKEVVESTGREKDKVIQILQEVQKKLNYLPSEALKEICRVTEITPGQISGVSTFCSMYILQILF